MCKKKRFKTLIEDIKSQYLQKIKEVEKGKIEFILNYFIEEDGAEERRAKFYELVKELKDIYDILSPDSFLREYIEDIKDTLDVYKIIKKAEKPLSLYEIDKELSRKFQELVREHIEQGDIEKNLEIYEINEETLRKLDEEDLSDLEKVFNLSRSIGAYIQREIYQLPYLKSIGEQASEIVELYKKRQINIKEALSKLKEIAGTLSHAEEERKNLEISPEEYTIYWFLKQRNITEAGELVRQILEKIRGEPFWKTNKSIERKLRKEILSILRISEDAFDIVDDILTTLKVQNLEL